MKLSPLQRRAERKERNKSLVDLNLVSLIDVFTILIFFLLSNSTAVETLPNSGAVKLPESTSEQTPKDTIVVLVNDKEILVQGRKVAAVADVIDANDDMIAPLKSELELEANRKTIRQDPNGQNGPNQAVTIMGDKAIPYRLLKKVMFTCARANFTEVAFAVRRKDA